MRVAGARSDAPLPLAAKIHRSVQKATDFDAVVVEYAVQEQVRGAALFEIDPEYPGSGSYLRTGTPGARVLGQRLKRGENERRPPQRAIAVVPSLNQSGD
jgi:hypothetical protein